MTFYSELKYSNVQIKKYNNQIRKTLFSDSIYIKKDNFDEISISDLFLLFELYDTYYFNNKLKSTIVHSGSSTNPAHIKFEFSNKMTKSAGRVTSRVHKSKTDQFIVEHELKLSSYLLFQTFSEDHRPIQVGGIICNNRLDVLLRVFEHELIHLLEMAQFKKTTCRDITFRNVIRNIFGHSDYRHDLITPQERAHVKFDLHKGDQVKFEFEGKELTGRIDRITKRATVLVESEEGYVSNDGKTYLKFYIPLSSLTKINVDRER